MRAIFCPWDFWAIEESVRTSLSLHKPIGRERLKLARPGGIAFVWTILGREQYTRGLIFI